MGVQILKLLRQTIGPGAQEGLVGSVVDSNSWQTLRMTSWKFVILESPTYSGDIEVPSLVDGKRRYLARVSDFVSWDEATFDPAAVSP